MDPNSEQLSASDRQRQTAAEIARRKVLAAYGKANEEKKDTNQAPKMQTASVDWGKYHKAWQEYYQKYYGEYYAQAARQALELEKLKQARAVDDERKVLEEINLGEEVNTVEQSSLQSEREHTIAYNLRQKVRETAIKQVKRSRGQRHVAPIVAGVSVVALFLFLQYNRLIFAPIMAYVAPGNAPADSITAIDPTVTQAVGPEPKLIIPKLNINVPVNLNLGVDNKTIMDAMNNGVAHFSFPGANALPGTRGNFVLTGHSAGDIYNSNQYKFIFSGLERLQNDDLIYVNYESKRYTYSVIKKSVVEPTDVGSLVLGNKAPFLTLITCTPLGTTRFRLLVFAKQISPAPETAKQGEKSAEVGAEAIKAAAMPANEPSFVERVWLFLTGRA